MAKGYLIAHVTVTDPDNYPTYVKAAGESFAKFGGRYIVRGGQFEAVEGDARERHVVIEFDTYEKARQAYHCAEYQEALKLRQQYGESEVILVEGAE